MELDLKIQTSADQEKPKRIREFVVNETVLKVDCE